MMSAFLASQSSAAVGGDEAVLPSMRGHLLVLGGVASRAGSDWFDSRAVKGEGGITRVGSPPAPLPSWISIGVTDARLS